MANAIGNKSLFFSTYQSFKKVKSTEMLHISTILNQMAQKAKSKNDERKQYLNEAVDRVANPLWQYLNMSLALKIWKRYLLIYDSIEKDEVDIDSGDFYIPEIEMAEDDNNRKQGQTKGGVAKQGSNLPGARRGSFLNNSKIEKVRSGSGLKKQSIILRTSKALPEKKESKKHSRQPSILTGERGSVQGSVQQSAFAEMNQDMDNLEVHEMAKRKEVIEKQIREESVKENSIGNKFN